MADEKDEDKESYSYVSEEEELLEPAAEPAPPRAASRPPRAETIAEGESAAAPRARSAPPGCAAKSAPAKRRTRSEDSREPSPLMPPPLRAERRKGSPRRGTAPTGPMRSLPPAGLDEPLPDADNRRRPPGESGGKGGKGKGPSGYGRRYQSCPHCWHDVAVTPRGSGLSQHMWWNEACIAWQLYSQGDMSWATAQWRAQEIKSRREHEWEPPGHDEVIPARSAAHRDKLEEAQKGEAQMLDEDETDLPKPEEEKKKKKRRSVAVITNRTLPQNGPAGVIVARRAAATALMGGGTRPSAAEVKARIWCGCRCHVHRWPSMYSKWKDDLEHAEREKKLEVLCCRLSVAPRVFFKHYCHRSRFE